jgi:phosphodiesterase/alkaline phosphatase D-like protein
MSQLSVGPLVRAVTPDSITIWTEWTHPCEAILHATVSDQRGTQPPDPLAVCSRTITVGNHHYALLQLQGLQASTWYDYRIASRTGEGEQAPTPAVSTLKQCFRTLDPPEDGNALRLAYGSCRKPSATGPDALNAFGSWLIDRFDERETAWPHLLLLIGDQIYADDFTGRRGRSRGTSSLTQGVRPEGSQRGAQTFADFASLYRQAWTSNDGIRQVLAVIPTLMIFDDHEITNGWNTTPDWRAHALKHGLESMLVDGLVAYRVYQGWGNPGAQSEASKALATLMQEAQQSGQDALEDLRAYMRKAVYEEIAPHWHYDVPTVPPLFVMDVRADRPALLHKEDDAYAPARIMSQQQMSELTAWIKEHDVSPVLLVSSVPVLLPPLIGFAEYLMGIRPFHNTPLRWLGRQVARVQQRVTRRMSFDHWPVFAATWHELAKLLSRRKHDIVVLSGDVHFSYAAEARRGLFRSRKRAALYQLVASPFSNSLDSRDARLVLTQARLKQAFFGGLRTRLCRLTGANAKARVAHDILMQNTVALVTFEPGSSGHSSSDDGRYSITQTYLGVTDGKLDGVAYQQI